MNSKVLSSPQPAAKLSSPGYRICSSCVMDTSVPDIRFDAAGVCNYCTAARQRLAREHFGEDDGRLERLIAQIRREGAGRPYDCVIGVSGGVDSTYVAWLVKSFGLRPIAVHFDNGWNSELAVENIERILKRLDFDLFTHVVDWDEFRDLQLAFLKSSVANSEIPTDHGIIATLYRVAARNRIGYILHGGNLATESIMPEAWMESSLDYRFLRAIHRRHGKKPLKTFPTLPVRKLGYYTLVRKIRYIGVLNYLPYNKESAMQLLEREIGWRRYEAKHFESIYTRWFQGFLLPVKYGIDKRRPHLSSMIVSGQLTRAEALTELAGEPYSRKQAEEDNAYICRKFGLSQTEFEAILTAPPKGINDYPNHEWLFSGFGHLVARVKAVATARA